MSNSFGLTHVKHIVAVSSCKGGVGKSTVAALLASELAKQGHKVGLLDADVYGPSLPSLFQIYNPIIQQNEFKLIEPVDYRGIKLMSFGFLLGDAPAVLRGPIVTRYIQQLLFQTNWGNLDYLIIDMPPGTGDIQLTITQGVRLSGAVIVTTRQTLSLVDVSRGILMFEKVQVPILGIIENMAYFMCDQCQHKHYLFGQHAAIDLSARFGLPVIAALPMAPHFATPVTDYKSTAPIADMAKTLKTLVDKQENQSPQPIGTHFDAHNIYIKFSEKEEIVLDNRLVRLACQCALCVNEITGKQILNPSKVKPDIAPTAITPLGHYALGIDFNDGHASGIYPLTLLKQMAA